MLRAGAAGVALAIAGVIICLAILIARAEFARDLRLWPKARTNTKDAT